MMLRAVFLPAKGENMGIRFETDYDMPALTAMAEALRKTD